MLDDANGVTTTGQEPVPDTLPALERALRAAEQELDALAWSRSASLADVAAALLRARTLLSRRDALLRAEGAPRP